MQRSRPLDGILVVSLEHAIAAPFCTRHLADLGARVIKVERPGGGDFARAYDQRVSGLASHFAWVNRSKESLSLDLKHKDGQEVLARLVARADVLVQNLAPGAAARIGLSPEVLRPRYPRLIQCDISGYGANGPYRDKKAYDLLIQAEAGLLSVTGTNDEACKAGISIADIAAGMYAYSSILAALFHRATTGIGAYIDLSMLESLTEWMGYPMYYAYQGASAPARTGAEHATIYPYGPFAVGDGQTILLGLQNEREWLTFCETVLLSKELAADVRFDSNARRTEHRAELRAIITDAFSTLTLLEVAERLDQASIAYARINDMAELWQHAQLKARNRWVVTDSPSGELPALLPPGANDQFDYRMDGIPAVGQHNQAILSELGFEAPQIERMRKAGAI